MPELPEVETVCSGLNPVMKNQLILKAEVNSLISENSANFLGLISYIALGGTTSDSMEGGEFMYGPCYGIPALCLITAFILGIKDDQRE